MLNQTDFSKVSDHFITPLSRIFSRKPAEEMVEAMAEDLRDYPPSILSEAARIIRRKCKYFPSIAQAMEACDEAQKAKVIPLHAHSEPRQETPWQQRIASRKRMVEDYLRQYAQSAPLWFEAVRDGWELELWTYLAAIAEIQAAMIAGEKNISWSSVIAFGIETRPEDDGRAFLIEQRQQANSGLIDVAVPVGRIAAWKSAVAWRKEQEEAKRSAMVSRREAFAPRAALPMPIPAKTAIDLEIERQMIERSPKEKTIVMPDAIADRLAGKTGN